MSGKLRSTLDEGQLVARRYRVLGPLGRGGMGLVYAALDCELERPVALKVLPSERCADPVAVERFLRQARALARIDHRGVVRVYDRGIHADELPYVVMEQLVGRDLQSALRERRFSPSEALSLALALCEAVEAVHRHGVLHRDLKPSNVFLVDGDRDAPLRLLDFGLALLPEQSPLTARGDVFGTLAYMAPELLRSASDASERSDLYAVACILYELLAGKPPFRARSRAELRAAIEHDPAEPLRAHTDVATELDALVLRNLAKDPRARQPSARELAAALRSCSGEQARADRVESAGQVPVHGRFELLRRLGAGSSGVVHEALDIRHGQRVALKQLRALGADELLHFKREFRTLSRLSHPNLIRLHELWVEGEQACFSMELIEGQDLLAAARAPSAQVRALFAQLASGLTALHERGLVHRDLKPANVLVGARGRVVLIDFGLAVAHAQKSALAGTPAYMAPETFEGNLGPEADMYALGVMLHEALTGALPRGGQGQPPGTGELAELWPLCCALLSADPAARPRAHQVLSQLAAAPNEELDAGSRSAAAVFIGRGVELRKLAGALEHSQRGGSAVWLVRGESGIGKSSLLARLELLFGDAALCLTSCARESEAIPYPALDAAIDALSAHLATLSRDVLGALLPRDVRALGELFPVMRQHVVRVGQSERLPSDPLEIRGRGRAALRRLMGGLAEQRPIVLMVDDVQWIDPDSSALLSYLLTGPERPHLLLIAALRSDAEPSAALRELLESLPEPASQLELAELLPPERHALVQALWPGGAPPLALSERIVAQAGGHPLFLSTLVAYAHDSEPSLEHALRARIDSLSAPARRLLVLASVCERPLPLASLLTAADLSGQRARDEIHALREARLVRRIEARDRSGLEPYHRRVRDVVLASLGSAERRAHHHALARALAGVPGEPEPRIEHLAAAGQGEAAALLALTAARSAAELCAFERAAALYEVALQHGQPAAAERADWLMKRAALLRRAGRGVDAAAALVEASELVDREAGQPLLREAGALLLLSGEVEEGLARLGPMLERAGLALPANVPDAFAEALTVYEELARRGLTAARRLEPAAASERERLALCLTLANGLAMIDLRGVPFALRALLFALELAEPEPLQRAAACFVSVTAGLFHNALIETALGLCRTLTAQLDSAYARALCHQAEGEAAHFTGRFLSAEAAFEQAERILLESCVDATRELAAVRNGAVLIEYAQKGDFRSQLTRTLRWQRDAQARKDVFHANMLRLAHTIVWVAQDQPDKARAELTARRWQRRGSAYEVGMLLFADIADRYQGDDDAHLHPLQGDQEILQSPAVATPFLSGYVHLHRAWGSIRALAHGRHARGEREMASSAIAALRLLGPELWQAVADAYDANLGYLAGDREPALAQLDRAERTFRRLHMRCLGACARLRHGELAGGEFGARLCAEASSELEQLGVVRPERWSRAYFSLFDPATNGDLTLAGTTV